MTLILLILQLIFVLGVRLRLSVVPTINAFFMICVSHMLQVTQRLKRPACLPLHQYGRPWKESSVHRRRKKLNRAVSSVFFTKNPVQRPPLIPLWSWTTKMPAKMSTPVPRTFRRQLIQTSSVTFKGRFCLPS